MRDLGTFKFKIDKICVYVGWVNQFSSPGALMSRINKSTLAFTAFFHTVNPTGLLFLWVLILLWRPCGPLTDTSVAHSPEAWAARLALEGPESVNTGTGGTRAGISALVYVCSGWRWDRKRKKSSFSNYYFVFVTICFCPFFYLNVWKFNLR